MRAVVVYESLFGATRTIAEAIARGLGPSWDVKVTRASDATPVVLEGADLVVVGGPTHVHTLPRALTRRGAPDYVSKSNGGLSLEPGADSAAGVREWLAALPRTHGQAAAFDTRLQGRALLTGRASKMIGRRLARHGFRLVRAPESFIVDRQSHLLEGEPERAEAWAAKLAA